MLLNDRIITVFLLIILTNGMNQTILRHIKCVNSLYPKSNINRFPVPEKLIAWSEKYEDYNPVFYESPVLTGKEWADPPIGEFTPKFNAVDEDINRVSYLGPYAVTSEGYPLNPIGRTGITGRGILGKWACNHAADPIVSRFKRTESGDIIHHPNTQKKILQVILIERHDCHEWAIPGGMVDPGEHKQISATLKREFFEEALNSDPANLEALEEFFNNGIKVYEGYVDDPRNTDNAWMETAAFNFHDDTGNATGRLKLHAGDDAAKVKWVDVDSSLKLYASHIDFIKTVVDRLSAHW